MSGNFISRRELLGAGAGLLLAKVAGASGRVPLQGKLEFRVPWTAGPLDPHRLEDVPAAIFGPSIFDALYRFKNGNLFPALAEEMPRTAKNDVMIRIRSGLRTARGRPLDAKDVALSIERARSLGAAGWLAMLGHAVPVSNDEVCLRSTLLTPLQVAAILASPLTAIVPRSFDRGDPDGTGSFRCDVGHGHYRLSRNLAAAEGPSFLDEIVVREGADLAASLRAFEAGTDALGWLGLGLYGQRAGALRFDFGPVAWAILRTGQLARAWDAPGVAQRVANGISPSVLAPLGGSAWTQEKEERWGDAPVAVNVRDAGPWLRELAERVAGALSRPGHTLLVRTWTEAEAERRMRDRQFALAVDVARPMDASFWGLLCGLTQADSPARAKELARHAPSTATQEARILGRSLRLGVLTDVRVAGATLADIRLIAGRTTWDLGSSTRGVAP